MALSRYDFWDDCDHLPECDDPNKHWKMALEGG
jgi:hypothetical protein